MPSVMEAPEVPAKYQASDGTWIQITFTLDPGQYRVLRNRAEVEGLTVPSFVQEIVTNSLERDKNYIHKKGEVLEER